MKTEKFFHNNKSTLSNVGWSPTGSLSFEWDIYQVVELDELIRVVCSIFAHRLSNEKIHRVYRVVHLSWDTTKFVYMDTQNNV